MSPSLLRILFVSVGFGSLSCPAEEIPHEYRPRFTLTAQSRANDRPDPYSRYGGSIRNECGTKHDQLRVDYPDSDAITIHFCDSSAFLWAVEGNCDWIHWGVYQDQLSFAPRASFLNHCNRNRRWREARGHTCPGVLAAGRRGYPCSATPSAPAMMAAPTTSPGWTPPSSYFPSRTSSAIERAQGKNHAIMNAPIINNLSRPGAMIGPPSK